MNRRTLLCGAAATAITLAVPWSVRASSALDVYYYSAFDRVIAPVCTNLVRPLAIERADTRPFWFTKLNTERWSTEVSYPHGAAVPATDYEAIHESGHAFAILLGAWYPGNWIRDFLSYHGARLAEDDLRLSEIFAEHFAAALGMPPYAGYPEYRDLVPFRSAADTRAWITEANRVSEVWAMARMQPTVVAVPVDANGNTTRDGVTVPVSGLRPGVAAQGIATRVGFTGEEQDIGTFVFATDTASQGWGRIHARGAKGGGTVYVVVSAIQ